MAGLAFVYGDGGLKLGDIYGDEPAGLVWPRRGQQADAGDIRVTPADSRGVASEVLDHALDEVAVVGGADLIAGEPDHDATASSLHPSPRSAASSSADGRA